MLRSPQDQLVALLVRLETELTLQVMGKGGVCTQLKCMAGGTGALPPAGARPPDPAGDDSPRWPHFPCTSLPLELCACILL